MFDWDDLVWIREEWAGAGLIVLKGFQSCKTLLWLPKPMYKAYISVIMEEDNLIMHQVRSGPCLRSLHLHHSFLD